MSSSKSENDIECKYCDEQLKQPYKLDCGHEVCFTCAQEMFIMAMLQKADVTSDQLAAKAKHKQQQLQAHQQVQNNNNTNLIVVEEDHTHIGIHCPQCNQKTLIERLVGPINSNNDSCNDETSMTKSSKAQCDNCEEDNVQDAEWFCEKCELHFCDDCFTTAHKPRAMAKHEKVSIQDQQESSVSTFTTNATALKKHFCGKHPDKVLEFYCSKCNEMTCIACSLVGDHKGHDHISLQKYIATIGSIQMQQFQQAKLPQLQAEITKCQRELEDKLKAVINSEQDTTVKLKQKFQNIRKMQNDKQVQMEQELLAQGSVCEFEIAAKARELHQLHQHLQVLINQSSLVQHGQDAILMHKTVKKMQEIEKQLVNSTTNAVEFNNEQANKYVEQVQQFRDKCVKQIDMIEQYKYDEIVQQLQQSIANEQALVKQLNVKIAEQDGTIKKLSEQSNQQAVTNKVPKNENTQDNAAKDKKLAEQEGAIKKTTVRVVEQPKADVPFKYETELILLTNMGLDDRERVRKLLVQFNGQVNSVVDQYFVAE